MVILSEKIKTVHLDTAKEKLSLNNDNNGQCGLVKAIPCHHVSLLWEHFSKMTMFLLNPGSLSTDV